MSRSRNVLTRAERIEVLTDRGEWKDGDSVFGLPKVRTVRHVKRRKPAKAEAEAAAVETAEEGAEKEDETPSK